MSLSVKSRLRVQLLAYYSLAMSGVPLIILAVVKKWLLAGLSLGEIILLQSIFGFSIMVLEIPTGSFSDTADRRVVLMVYTLTAMLGLGIYGLAESFWWFALAEVVLGLSVTLFSGTGSAFAYEALFEAGEAGRVKQVYGRIGSVSLVWHAVALLVGGLVVNWNLYGAFILGVLVYVPSLVLLFFAEEPEHVRAVTMKKALGEASRSLVKHSSLVLYLMLVIMFRLIGRIYFWSMQVRLFSLMISPVVIGGFLSVTSLVSAVGSWLNHRLEGKRFVQGLLVGSYVVLAVVFLLRSDAWFTMSMWLFMEVIRGTLQPFFSGELQKDVSSQERATVVSLISTIGSLMYGGFGVAINVLALSSTVILVSSLVIGGACGLVVEYNIVRYGRGRGEG